MKDLSEKQINALLDKLASATSFALLYSTTRKNGTLKDIHKELEKLIIYFEAVSSETNYRNHVVKEVTIYDSEDLPHEYSITMTDICTYLEITPTEKNCGSVYCYCQDLIDELLEDDDFKTMIREQFN